MAEDNWDSSEDRLIEFAMGIICNAGGGDWSKETDEWQKAARRWMDLHSEYVSK